MECGNWLTCHADRSTVTGLGRRWALGFGSALRSTVDTDSDLDAAIDMYLTTAPTDNGPLVAWFTVSFHAAKLHANLHGNELVAFLDHSSLGLAASPYTTCAPLPALRTFAALRSPERDSVKRAQDELTTLGDPDGNDDAVVLSGPDPHRPA